MKSRNYRKMEPTAYTRNKYMRRVPTSELRHFSVGEYRDDYTHKVKLISKRQLQIMSQALESARQKAAIRLRALNRGAGENAEQPYHLVIKAHPHHVTRENRMLNIAKAERMQEGMRRSFGKATWRAARVKRGQVVLETSVYEDAIEVAKGAMKHAAKKLPGTYRVMIEKVA